MDAIVVMAKAPQPHRVKTRLIPPLTGGEAARLYHGFLLDKLDQVLHVGSPAHRVIAYTPDDAEPFFRALAGNRYRLLRQAGGDLGERLSSAAGSLFAEGCRRVLLLDSDTPHLPPAYIQSGLMALERSDVVIGPCDDGGYYLVGMRRHTPALFRGIPWSTPAVTARTIRRAGQLGLTVALLDRWFDVDTIADLVRLKRDLESGGDSGQFPCVHTRTALLDLDLP
ncbi:MAG: TIGR04282 family arsenosugar biosynthesis glycosyltransferase [Methanomicrobiales archaeon]|nr:TIGR04282 family arsenosugar biosynthesis glycosyltransferase [Methanomicrobiales archaeon]MDI6876763.1 TIGR04282 family arsenosugar biosynthesis glycosyltransferase [Methanomicrobiales archaeon]